MSLKKHTDSFIEILGIYFILLMLVSFVFSVVEAKTFFESVWWACATAMTVGYGDIYPATMTGKVLAMVWMHVVPLVVVPMIITRLMVHIVDDKNAFTNEEQEEIKNLLTYIRDNINARNNPESGK